MSGGLAKGWIILNNWEKIVGKKNKYLKIILFLLSIYLYFLLIKDNFCIHGINYILGNIYLVLENFISMLFLICL